MKFGDLSSSDDDDRGVVGHTSDSDAPVRVLPRDKAKGCGRQHPRRKNKAARRRSSEDACQSIGHAKPGVMGKASSTPQGGTLARKPGSSANESESRPSHIAKKRHFPAVHARPLVRQETQAREIAFYVSGVPIYFAPGRICFQVRQMRPRFPKLKHENYDGVNFHGMPVNLPAAGLIAFGAEKPRFEDSRAQSIDTKVTPAKVPDAAPQSSSQITSPCALVPTSPTGPMPPFLSGPKTAVPAKPAGPWGSGKVLFPKAGQEPKPSGRSHSSAPLALEPIPSTGARSPPISPVSTASSGTSSGPGPTDSAVFVEIPSDLVAKFDVNRYLLKQRTIVRGLVNPGNMCFLNSILQALVYTPPFYNFVMALSQTAASFVDEAPLTESIITHFHQLHPFDPRRPPSGRIEAFSSEHIYDVLKVVKKLNCMKGTQEDAEEFLTHILDGVHEELLKVGGTSDAGGRAIQTGMNGKSHEAGNEEWVEVGPKNKVSTTRRMESKDSPITRIFGGVFRSTLKAAGQKDSVTFEPFQTLQLDITMDNINSVADALRNLTQPEIIDSFTVKHAKVQAQKQVVIDQAPPVLMLQLKRFMYTPEGGCRKNTKPFRYPPVLDMTNALTPAAAGSARSRKYALTAVVYHHGSTLSTGHYTCAVQDHGVWSVLDDAHVFKTDVAAVCGPKNSQEAYLLFYTRADSPASPPTAQPPLSSSPSSSEARSHGQGGWQKARSRPRTPPHDGSQRGKFPARISRTQPPPQEPGLPSSTPPHPPPLLLQGLSALEPHLNFQRLSHRREPYRRESSPEKFGRRR